ncbi:MAG: methyltransferase domain-containing protein [Pseudomonadota bacterium]
MKREAEPQSIDILPALETWYDGYPADEMCAAIRGRMQSIVDRAFGYHVLQLGPLPKIDLVDTSRINHRIYASTSRSSDNPGLHCHGDELPFASDSMDMVVAFHALEFDEHPHGTLREVQRVLRPHGQLVVIGFNPVSLLGATLRFRRWRSQPPWSEHRPVRVGRLTDWLHLLDCKLESVNYLYPIPLRGRGRLNTWIHAVDGWAAQRKLPGGSVYVAHAIKQIAGMRRPRPLPVRARERLVGLAVGPSPTPREPQLGSADAARISVSESANDS